MTDHTQDCCPSLPTLGPVDICCPLEGLIYLNLDRHLQYTYQSLVSNVVGKSNNYFNHLLINLLETRCLYFFFNVAGRRESSVVFSYVKT